MRCQDFFILLVVQLVLNGLVLVPLCYASTTLKLHTASKINFLRKIELFHDIKNSNIWSNKMSFKPKNNFCHSVYFRFWPKYSNLSIEKSVLEHYLRHYFWKGGLGWPKSIFVLNRPQNGYFPFCYSVSNQQWDKTFKTIFLPLLAHLKSSGKRGVGHAWLGARTTWVQGKTKQ